MIYQLQPVECSAASLGMILGYYGKWVTLEDLRYYCNVTRDGASVLNIVEAAEHFGLIGKGYRRSLADLKNKTKFPCIIHWNYSHFVVLRGFRGDDAIINDPAKGRVIVKHDELNTSFTGIVIEFEKGDNFIPSGKKPSTFSIVYEKLKSEKTSFIISFVLVMFIATINIIKPLLDKIFIDRVLLIDSYADIVNTFFASYLYQNNLNIHFIITVILLAMIEVICIFVNEKIDIRIEVIQATKANTAYMWHILNLPFNFFERREYSDLHQRKSIATDLIKNLIDCIVPYFFQILSIVFYVVVMILYDARLGLFGILSIVVSYIITSCVNNMMREKQKKATIDNAILYNTTVSGIEMIETIKKGGNESNYINNWIGVFNKNLNSIKTIEECNINYILLLDIINNIVSILLIYFGMKNVIEGNWTIGMVIAFQGFYNNCSNKILDATDSYKAVNNIIPNIERIDDVINYNIDDTFSNQSIANKELYKFNGNISIKNLSFRYKPFGDMLLSNINLDIKDREKVAIVGKSGCGKSTLARIIMGMYKPNEGEILYDGRKINDIDKYEFYNSMQYLNTNTIFFNDTIKNNIKMWDQSISDEDIVKSTIDAEIFSEINKKEDGLKYICKENAKEFSGGQKQRLEIARALAIDPNIMIIDEATNALDLGTEKKVLNNIFEKGITSIFITHRISIMERCDRIIIIENGKIVEEGKHDELIKNSKRYNELILKG